MISENKKLTDEEKEKAIQEIYLKAILECIKYLFKNESLKMPNGKYNIWLLNEILNNTKGQRLYSRFGAFYKVKDLNFNRFEKPDNDEVNFNEANSETAINPHTIEEVPIEETQLCILRPESLHYTIKTDKEPIRLINTHNNEIFNEI